MKRKEEDQERNLETLRVKPNMGGAVQASRQILLDAGFGPVLIKEAVKQLNQCLKEAVKVRFAVSNGKVIDSIRLPDYDNRMKAAALVFNLAGCTSQRDSDSKMATVNVQVINYAAPSKDNVT